MLDLDRITHPLRLAKGSHKPGSGKGCAMNVLSYINGDTKITDYPDCSARPLARLVQMCNDTCATMRGHDAGGVLFLSPQDSVLVLDLGWQTFGTADVDDSVVAKWTQTMCPEQIERATTVEAMLPSKYRRSTNTQIEIAGIAADATAAPLMKRPPYLILDFTRRAIACWRELAELDAPNDIDADVVDGALALINA